MARIVAIHQPNFFPWLGYFDKIRRADVFVFLDDAQFQKTGGTWTNRVKLLDRGKPCWLTAPVERNFHGVRPVNAMKFAMGNDWVLQALRKIEACYRDACFFDETMTLVRPLLATEEANVANYNIHAIGELLRALGMPDKELLRSSAISTQTRSTDRLIDITRAAGGTHYLYGGGASGYQDDAKFAQAGLGLIAQEFAHPRYEQTPGTEFTPGLSIIDVLMHCGMAGATRLLTQGPAPTTGEHMP